LNDGHIGELAPQTSFSQLKKAGKIVEQACIKVLRLIVGIWAKIYMNGGFQVVLSKMYIHIIITLSQIKDLVRNI
jgi:hypothetical protein